MNTRHFLIVLLGLVLVFVGGCDPHAEDKQQIRQLLHDWDHCNNTRNGARVVTLMTRETFEHYDRLLKLSLDGSPQQVQALKAVDMLEVLRMRARSNRAELSKLNGRQYMEFATSRGWYLLPPEERTVDTLRDFRFGQNDATAELVTDRVRTGARLRFEKQDGDWKIDEPYSLESFDPLYRDEARDMGMSLPQFIIYLLEEEIEGTVPETIWQPLRR